ncbi:GTPase IMAP family member 7-like [Patella vulgata]|uniref:GTPase IMAP family member 7-like n=1 Tax=Patella vulgata TaxID=6465 RepID=UPI0024A82A9A|nr:GTPase IMAP family member 7-like [Patella vulgata]
MEEIRVSIIGKTGVGKSALGNALLQHNIFKSQQQITSVTSECGSGQRHLQLNGVDTLLKVVDTPGLFDTGNSNKTIAKEIVKCIHILSPGPHLFIMVFRIDLRLSKEDIKVLEYFKNTFGELIDKFAVVVFTGKDLLVDRSEDGAIGDFHTHLSTFSDVFKHCQSATINNGRKHTTEGKTKDVDGILQLLQTTIQKNGGAYYKNEMYEVAKKLFEARIQDQEVVNQNRWAEIAKLTKQIEQFKQREEEQKQREEQWEDHQKQREEEQKQREEQWEEHQKQREEEQKQREARIQDQEVVNQNRWAEIAKLTKQIEQFKQREEQWEEHQKQREEEQKQREEQWEEHQKQRENDLRNWELALKPKDGLSYTEQATTSAYQYESPPRAKRRKFISRREKGMMSPEDNSRIISNYYDSIIIYVIL